MSTVDVRTLTTAKLFAVHAVVLEELRRRHVIRTSNNPLGDLAEALFSKAFGWKLDGNSHDGRDAVDTHTGTRYQIKARRLTDPKTSRELSVIRDIEGKPFDYLAGLLVDLDYDVIRAALVPFPTVRAGAIYSKHVNGWRFHLRDCVWRESGVLDVTEKLREVFVAM
jgi:hypothetical protein